jgi:dihydroorotase
MALQRFPGLIDIHVHLRDPGATHKEDFRTGTRAAVKGGFTFVCDMPNNYVTPTTTIERVEEKVRLTAAHAICDVGFHFGTDGKNFASFKKAAAHPRVYGLKIYCNHTTGEMLIENESTLDLIFRSWESDKPILVHAEGDQLGVCLELARRYIKRLHVCHISDVPGIELVRYAKESGQAVTAGVTPHHLFLKSADVKKLGPYGLMKPPIGDESTRLALWEAVKNGVIDIIESDHAPHTRLEKASGAPPFGVPNLETTIGLLVHEFVDGKLTLQQIVTLLYDNPKKIFNIPDQPDTFIELDPQKPYIAGASAYETKCGWSPFDGWQLFGEVERVVLRGKTLVDGKRIV